MESKSAIRALALLVSVFSSIGFSQPGLLLKTGAPTGRKESQATAELKRRSLNSWHYTLVFRNTPGQAEVQALQDRGAMVVQFVPERGLTVAVPDGVSLDGLDLEWAGRLTPEQKVSPRLANADSAEQTIVVDFHADVTRADAEAIINEEGLMLQQNPDLLSWQVMVRGSTADLIRLAQWDEVSYLFPASSDLAEGRPVEACAGAIVGNGRIGQLTAKVGEGWDGAGKGSADLTYSWGAMTRKLTADQAKAEILRAMQEWAKYVKVKFTAGGSASSTRNLNILFGTGDHGDGYAFDGAGKALAHTFFPAPPNPEPIAGDLHLDDDEGWQSGGSVDLYSVALHELGHALGLAHSDNPAAVMYPYYKKVTSLATEDISTVQELYAKQDGTTPTTPTTSALTLSLTQPASGVLQTQTDTASIAGTTAGGTGTVTVIWSSDKGYSGQATGYRPWTIATVPLITGDNVITIVAVDGAATRVTQVVRITRQSTTTTTPASTTPIIAITAPAVNGSYQTTQASITLSGTAGPSGSVSRIVWVSSRGAGGSIVGGTTWTIGPIPLEPGLNDIRVTAVTAQGATADAAISVTYSPAGNAGTPTDPNDKVAPMLAIISPNVSTLSTPAATITISGTAADNVGVAEVNWASNSGRSGKATGTTSWTIADVALSPGINVFVIRAYDAVGNMSWRSLVVTRQ